MIYIAGLDFRMQLGSVGNKNPFQTLKAIRIGQIPISGYHKLLS